MKKINFIALLSGIFWSLSAIIVGVIFFNPLISKLHTSHSGLLVSAFGEVFGFVFILILLIYKNKVKEVLKTKGILYIVLGALFSGPIGMSTYYMAIHLIGGSIADAMSGIYPVLIVIFAAIFFKERYDFKTYIGTFITVIGVYILISTGLSGKLNIHGIVFSIITAICWSIEALILDYISINKKIDWEIAIFMRQLTTTIGYLLFVIPFLIYFSEVNVVKINYILHSKFFLGLCILNGLCVASSYGCFYYAISKEGAGIPAILNMTYIGWTPFLSFLFYPLIRLFVNVGKFHLTTQFYFAAPIIIMGVTMVLFYSSKEK